MDNQAAVKALNTQPVLEYGRVIEETEGGWRVAVSFGTLEAQAAAGCLLRPRTGDETLISLDPQGRCYILSVLTRDPDQGDATDILLQGRVNLHVKDGDLNLLADKTLGLASGDSIRMASSGLDVKADSGSLKITNLSLAGRLLNAQIKMIKVVGKSVDHVCARFTQRLVNAFRFVREHDEVQAGTARYLVEETLTMHSKNALHMADELVKIDGEEVHLG